MDDKIIISPDDIEVIDAEGYSYEVVEQFDKVPEVAKNLVKGAKATFSRIEKCFIQHRDLSIQLRVLCQKKHYRRF